MLAAVWSILEEAAIFILVGFAVAGLLEALVVGGRLLRLFRGESPRSVVLATLLGVPLPLCSCSVLPTALTLRRKGAGKGATLSFLIATPETSVTSILLTYALMGPLLAIVRPIAAAVTAITAGLAENALTRRLRERAGHPVGAAADDDAAHADTVAGGRDTAAGRVDTGAGGAEAASDPACAAGAAHAHAGEADDACADGDHTHVPPELADEGPAGPMSLRERLRRGVRFAFVDLFDDIFGWMVVGIVAAAAIQVWLPPDALSNLPGGEFTTMLAMVAIGVPLYVCAEASTPIAAALVAQGLDPGAALVFLLVGPATNIGSLGALDKQLGRRTVVVYLTTIVVVALAFGGLLDAVLGSSDIGLRMRALAEPLVPEALEQAGAIAFVVLGIASARRLRYGPRLRAWLDRRLPVRVTMRRLVATALTAALVAWASTGLTVVRAGEVGLVKRFGALVRTDVAPGLHVGWPAPLETVETVAVRRLHRLGIGLFSDAPGSLPDRRQSWHLVGDENVAELILAVHWGARADAPVAFRFAVADQAALVRNAVLGVARRELGGMPIDIALTSGRRDLELAVRRGAQERLDACRAGIRLAALAVLDAHAPIEVHAAFRDVAGALEDRTTQIHDARADEAQQIPHARAEAERILAEARGAAAGTVHRARGEAERFAALLDAYRRWPDVTRRRLELETLETVLPRVRKYLKPPEPAGGEIEIWFGGEEAPGR